MKSIQTASESLNKFTSSQLTSLIQSISIYLSHSINSGDSLIRSTSNTFSTPTRFQAQSKPSIDIHDYLSRLVNFSPIPIDGILLGLVYLKRIATAPNHESPKPSSNLVPINSLTIHRLILSCMILATKFVSDRPLPRKRLGKVAGVSETELDHLERDLLVRLDFKLCWSTQEVDQLASDVLSSSHSPSPSPSTPPSNLIQASSTSSSTTPPPILNSLQSHSRSSISSPITHPSTSLPLHPTARRHSNSRGIVFVKSQFIDCNLLTRKYGPHPINKLQDLDHSQNSTSPTDPTSTAVLPPTPRSSSKIIVTRLEHKQIKICHTQVF